MTAIVNDFLALQASFKAYEEKRRREIAGEPEVENKDANAGENAEAVPSDVSKSERERKYLDRVYGMMPSQKLYPVIRERKELKGLKPGDYRLDPLLSSDLLEQYRKRWIEAFRVSPELLEGQAYDIRVYLENKRKQMLERWANTEYLLNRVPNCRCVICRER